MSEKELQIKGKDKVGISPVGLDRKYKYQSELVVLKIFADIYRNGYVYLCVSVRLYQVVFPNSFL